MNTKFEFFCCVNPINPDIELSTPCLDFDIIFLNVIILAKVEGDGDFLIIKNQQTTREVRLQYSIDAIPELRLQEHPAYFD